MTERILVVEDEVNIASFVSAYLEKAGYVVDRAVNGAEAKEKAVSANPSLILLDLNLPDMDGLEVCRHVRATSTVPILMLTARDDDVDKIVGLEVGADDYLTKPFNPRSSSRASARSCAAPPRRRPVSKGAAHAWRDSIDAGRRELSSTASRSSSRPRSSTSSGLLDHSGLVLTRDQLLERVWGYTFAGDTRTVDVHVRQLRRKIGDTCPIVTVWGVGYKVADDASAVS